MQAWRLSAAEHERWDSFVTQADNGTLLHTRRFLDYHGDRFVDCSLVIGDGPDRWFAVLPLAASKSDPEVAVSHPGATFGGLVTSAPQRADRVRAALEAAFANLWEAGYRSLIYRPQPAFLGRQPDAVALQAMLALNAEIKPKSLFSMADLREPLRLSKGRKWGIGKARKVDLRVELDSSEESYLAFYDVLQDCLDTRHGAEPLHSRDEFLDLRTRCAEDAVLAVALDAHGAIAAGSWLLRYQPRVWHTQYIASTPAGREHKAVDLLVHEVMARLHQQDARVLSLGPSPGEGPLGIDEGLFNFKAGCGCGTEVQWELVLDV